MALSVPSRGRPALTRRVFGEPLAAKVPEITAWFWLVKILTTAAGEATSDALKTLGNIVGGGTEVLLFVIGIALQFRSRRYTAIAYWFLAYAIATFGTGVADFLHLDVGIPYAGTTILWAVILAAVFWLWYRSEGTLSIHSITTTRRELFYWATVFATFALGTALGDFTASAVGIGYLASGILFAVIILVPAVAYRWFGMNSILAFWFAYVVTRPLGASFADYISKPPGLSGIGFGDPQTALVLGSAIVACVVYLAIARPDVQVTLTTGQPTTSQPEDAADGLLLARAAPDSSGERLGDDRLVAGPNSLDRAEEQSRMAVRHPQRRHLGGWPPRDPTAGAATEAPAPLPARPRPPSPPASSSAPVTQDPAPKAPMPPVPAPRAPVSRDHPASTGPWPDAPSLRPRPPAPGPPPGAAPVPPRRGGGEAEQFDPLLRDLLAWGLVEPDQQADDSTWHLADDARHRLEDLHTHTETNGAPLVYFDRVCAGCRRRQLTRLHDGAYLCDACLDRSQTANTRR